MKWGFICTRDQNFTIAEQRELLSEDGCDQITSDLRWIRDEIASDDIIVIFSIRHWANLFGGYQECCHVLEGWMRKCRVTTIGGEILPPGCGTSANMKTWARLEISSAFYEGERIAELRARIDARKTSAYFACGELEHEPACPVRIGNEMIQTIDDILAPYPIR